MNAQEKLALVTLIQVYATGKVNNFFSPQVLAEAISEKIDFEQPIDIFSANKNREAIKNAKKQIRALKKDMEEELKKLDKEEKLFANFLRGKITAYKEVLDLIK